MRRYSLPTTALIVVLLIGGAQAQSLSLTIQGETKVAANRMVRLTLVGMPVESAAWDVIYGPDISYPVDFEVTTATGTSVVFCGPAGVYRVTAWAVSSGKMVHAVQGVVIGLPPLPPPPPPPPPPPSPTPAPIPAPGFRVLILYESSELSKMPPPQLAILYDKSLRDHLDAVTATAAGGLRREYRFYDKDVEIGAESDLWRNVMRRPHPVMPWMVISNGDNGTGYEGPLPATVADTLTLIKKYESAVPVLPSNQGVTR